MPPASGRASTRFRDPHCWPNWSKRPAPSADPNPNPTAPTPLSPATAESETHDTGAAAAPRTTTGEKKKNGIFFVQCSTGSSGWDGEPGSGIKIEPCHRKSRGVGSREISLFALAASDGLFLWSFCLVFGKHLVVFPFVRGFFFRLLLSSYLVRNYVGW